MEQASFITSKCETQSGKKKIGPSKCRILHAPGADYLKPPYVLYPTRVKNAVRMRAFPASGANLHVPPPIEIIRDTKTN